MIRPADLTDIPEILGMVEALRAHVDVPQALDRSHAAGFLAALMGSTDGLVLVVARGGLCGFLAASVTVTSINPERVAIEHGWFSRAPGWGGKLLAEYETWARKKGCALIRLSSGPDGSLDAMMGRRGYAPAEVAWVKRVQEQV